MAYILIVGHVASHVCRDVRLIYIKQDFRFLSVDQALADQAYFAQNVVFPGHNGTDLTAASTPYFAIGGS